MPRLMKTETGDIMLNGEYIGRVRTKRIGLRHGPKLNRVYTVSECIVYCLRDCSTEFNARNEDEAIREVILAYALS
jgi:hypothetical protein